MTTSPTVRAVLEALGAPPGFDRFPGELAIRFDSPAKLDAAAAEIVALCRIRDLPGADRVEAMGDLFLEPAGDMLAADRSARFAELIGNRPPAAAPRNPAERQTWRATWKRWRANWAAIEDEKRRAAGGEVADAAADAVLRERERRARRDYLATMPLAERTRLGGSWTGAMLSRIASELFILWTYHAETRAAIRPSLVAATACALGLANYSPDGQPYPAAPIRGVLGLPSVEDFPEFIAAARFRAKAWAAGRHVKGTEIASHAGTSGQNVSNWQNELRRFAIAAEKAQRAAMNELVKTTKLAEASVKAVEARANAEAVENAILPKAATDYFLPLGLAGLPFLVGAPLISRRTKKQIGSEIAKACASIAGTVREEALGHRRKLAEGGAGGRRRKLPAALPGGVAIRLFSLAVLLAQFNKAVPVPFIDALAAVVGLWKVADERRLILHPSTAANLGAPADIRLLPEYRRAQRLDAALLHGRLFRQIVPDEKVPFRLAWKEALRRNDIPAMERLVAWAKGEAVKMEWPEGTGAKIARRARMRDDGSTVGNWRARPDYRRGVIARATGEVEWTLAAASAYARWSGKPV